MTTTVLSLPVDVPWKLLAQSADMYATDIQNPLPIKWRTTVPIFYYEPDPDQDAPTNDEETTAFLKVVATITGFQPDLLTTDDVSGGAPYFTTTVQNAANLVKYYPALAALLQVA